MRKKLQFFPTCGSPDKTLSFRATTTAIAAAAGEFQEMASTGEPTGEIETSIEPVIRGLSSDRFFFKPGKTSSILDEAKEKEKEKEKEKVLEFKESVSMMEMESTDPFVDFKKSMQEMVEADEGLKEWDNLQELLSLYLAVNDKINHGYIIRAFVDLMLVNFGATSSSSSLAPSSCSSSSSLNVEGQSLLMEESNKKMIISSKSPESALSFTSSSASSSGTCSSTSNCLSSCSLEEEEEEEEEEEDDDNSVQKEVDSDNASSSFSSSKV